MSLGTWRVRVVPLLALVPWGAVPAAAEPSPAPEAKEAVIRFARASLSGVAARIARCSFEYKLLPALGSLPRDAALERLRKLADDGTSLDFVSPCTPERWAQVADDARIAWNEPRSRQAAEFDRVVSRYGNNFVDEDRGLRQYRVERPTASREHQSPDRRVTWLPLSKQVTVSAGASDLGARPSPYYFLSPPALAFAGMHVVCEVEAVYEAKAGWTVVMRREREEYRYAVEESLRWLPREATRLVAGQVVEKSAFQWMMVEGVGEFPSLIATVEMSGDPSAGSLRLACFSNPTLPAPLFDGFKVPPGTTIVDVRRSPARSRVIADHTELDGDLSGLLSVGGALPVPPEVLSMCQPSPGGRPPKVLRAE